jgi:hypothetical protein
MRPVRRREVETASRRADRLYAECKDAGALAINLQDVTSLKQQINANSQAFRRLLGLAGILPPPMRRTYVWLSVPVRDLSKRWGLDWYAMALIAASPFVVLTMLVLLPFTRSPLVIIFGALVGLIAAYAFWSLCLLVPSHESILRAKSIAEQQKIAKARHRRLTGLAQLRLQYDDALSDYQELLKRFESRKNQLQLVDWRSLRSIEFEDFLEDVFNVLGYAVETTKASGDQGIDLIAKRGQRQIGIQAKGYTNNVGNAAVQEAFSGMVHYGCTECVVITNSYFTRGAYELAASTGCRLVGGDQIRDLIDGKLF